MPLTIPPPTAKLSVHQWAEALLKSPASLVHFLKQPASAIRYLFRASIPFHVVTFCGSTRFKDAWQAEVNRQSLLGRVVLSVEFFMHADGIVVTPEQKRLLDLIHLYRIALSDEVFVINVGGYIGESTAREIAFASALGVPIRYLEPDQAQNRYTSSVEADAFTRDLDSGLDSDSNLRQRG